MTIFFMMLPIRLRESAAKMEQFKKEWQDLMKETDVCSVYWDAFQKNSDKTIIVYKNGVKQ